MKKAYNEVETIEQFNWQDQKQFTNLFYSGDLWPNEWKHYEQKPVEPIPDFEDLEWSALDIGLENYSLVAGHKVMQILGSRKNANKLRALFYTFIDTVYGVQKPYDINKYWKALTDTQKSYLDEVLTNYLVHEYNRCIEELNYTEEVA